MPTVKKHPQVQLKPVSKQAFDPNFLGGDAVVKPHRIHV
jgi:hypothetical protein